MCTGTDKPLQLAFFVMKNRLLLHSIVIQFSGDVTANFEKGIAVFVATGTTGLTALHSA
jgi:hypothetical protein